MPKRAAMLLLLTTLACATRPTARPPAPVAAAPVVPPAVRAEIQRIEGLLAGQPDNLVYAYVLATYYDRAHDATSVARLLARLDEREWLLGVGPDSFANTGNVAAVRAALAKLEARETAVHRAAPAFAIGKEHQLRSEGIAYDPVDDVFYFHRDRGSLWRVDRRGNAAPLAHEPLPEQWMRLGMDVDAARRQLWIVGAGPDGTSNVSVYSLPDARLLRQVSHGTKEAPSFLNDLTLQRDGTAFVTDTGRHHVVRLAPDAQAFEVWAEDFRGPNGIALSSDERALYVADFRGLNRFTVADKSRQLLELNTLLNGIDGLTEHRGTLIGIQNVLGRPRVVRVHIDDNHRVEVLEAKNPALDVPATGAVAGDAYYFLANLGQKDADAAILKIELR